MLPSVPPKRHQEKNMETKGHEQALGTEQGEGIVLKRTQLLGTATAYIQIFPTKELCSTCERIPSICIQYWRAAHPFMTTSLGPAVKMIDFENHHCQVGLGHSAHPSAAGRYSFLALPAALASVDVATVEFLAATAAIAAETSVDAAAAASS